MARETYKDFGSAILAYRNRPEGPIEPMQTNWSVVPANDNDPSEIADFGYERVLLVTPSVREIMRQVATKDVERNEAGQIVRIGTMRFSDGSNTERAYCYGADDKVIQFDCPMPIGAMLGTVEKAKQETGGRGYTNTQLERSNDFFAETLGTIAPRYIKRSKRRNGKSLSADESRAVLAKAIANTETMPPVTYCKPGLPCGAERVADSFLGMQKAKKGESGAMMWQDIASAKIHREIWDEALAQLSKEDVTTLDAAMGAKSIKDLAPGKKGGNAYASGSIALTAANDNLTRSLKRAYG